MIPQLLLEEADASGVAGAVCVAMDWAIWLTFLAEVVVMLRVVDDRKAWVRAHSVDIAIVALTPPIASGLLASVRLLRLLRLVRLLRLAPLVRGAFALSSLAYAALLAVLTMFAGGVAFAEVEPTTTSAEGIYWALTTMTTVGYGDLAPTTNEGRLVAGFVMLVGIGFVATLTAAIADRLIVAGARTRHGEEQGLATRLERIEQLLDDLVGEDGDHTKRPSGRFTRTAQAHEHDAT